MFVEAEAVAVENEASADWAASPNCFNEFWSMVVCLEEEFVVVLIGYCLYYGGLDLLFCLWIVCSYCL